MTIDNFLFTELSDEALTAGKPFAGFATGEFVDMLGRTVKFAKKDLAAYLKNTLAFIGELQSRGHDGLPIDAMRHERGEAAGWITGAEIGEVSNSEGETVPVILLAAKWTKLGVELIRDRILVNFSPSVDRESKRIAGGSLTNWPASVDANGVPLFSAVELSQGVYVLEHEPAGLLQTIAGKVDQLLERFRPGGVEQEEPAELAGDVVGIGKVAGETEPAESSDGGTEMSITLEKLTDEQRDEVLAQARASVMEELGQAEGETVDGAVERLKGELQLSAFSDVANLDETRDQLVGTMKEVLEAELLRVQSQSGAMLAQMMADMKRQQHIADFAQRVTGGTDDAPRAIPAKAEDVDKFLSSLTDGQRVAAEAILSAIVDQGLVEFGEVGHGRRVQGTAQLEPETAALLEAHIKAGGKVAEFFAATKDILGDMDSYDLSQYKEA